MTDNVSHGNFTNKVAAFNSPTQLPRDEEQHDAWQAANKAWWENSPMRYDWRANIGKDPGSVTYFSEIDRRFLSSIRRVIPWREIPFDGLISFDELKKQDVLEIGVGHGTHAQILAPHAGSFVGIDLTSFATEMTNLRFELFNISGKIVQMDAEKMNFADNSFDYIWSWGVIHHSADTSRVLNEMHRVLRPNGRCTVMVYYRSWWSYYMFAFLKGFLKGRLLGPMDLLWVRQAATDGAIARYYTHSEWRHLVAGLFTVENLSVYGMSIELIPLPHGLLKRALTRAIPDSIAHFLTRRLLMGSFLVAQMRKN